MDREQYGSEMDQVKQSALGLEMINHVATCETCRKILEDANKQVVDHLARLS